MKRICSTGLLSTVALVLALVFATLMLAGCDGEEDALPTPTEAFFVNDYANILDEADEQTIYDAGMALYSATKAQVVLVTVENTGNRDLEGYALALAREWALGTEEQDNGLLLLFTTEGPHSRMEIGYGLEGAIPDSKAGRILDTYLVPRYADETAWSAALTETYTAILNEVYAEYGLMENQLPLDTPVAEEYEEGGLLDALIVVLFLAVVVVVAFGSRHTPGGHYRGGHGGYIGGFGGFRGGGGGGFRGGGFRGGGGGFGGGGASR